MKQLCIVPRWSGGPDSDFYPWLRAQPVVAERFSRVLCPTIAEPDTPTIAAWVDSLERTVGETLADTFFLGHSVGCQAVLRYLAAQPAHPGAPVAPAVLCVAGWWEVDEPWETIIPWCDSPLDHARVRARAERFMVLLSDNDPFTADWHRNQAQWRERLGADVTTVLGAKHFNRNQEPAVLDALVKFA